MDDFVWFEFSIEMRASKQDPNNMIFDDLKIWPIGNVLLTNIVELSSCHNFFYYKHALKFSNKRKWILL
jgi:hypothetical protein